jgi:hypothetical protein
MAIVRKGRGERWGRVKPQANLQLVKIMAGWL